VLGLTGAIIGCCTAYRLCKPRGTTGITSLNILRYDPEDPDGDEVISDDNSNSANGDGGPSHTHPSPKPGGAHKVTTCNTPPQHTVAAKPDGASATSVAASSTHTPASTAGDTPGEIQDTNTSCKTPHTTHPITPPASPTGDTIKESTKIDKLSNNKEQTDPNKTERKKNGAKARFLERVKNLRKNLQETKDKAKTGGTVDKANESITSPKSVVKDATVVVDGSTCANKDASVFVDSSKSMCQDAATKDAAVVVDGSTCVNKDASVFVDSSTSMCQDAATSPIITHRGANSHRQPRATSEPRSTRYNVRYKKDDQNVFLNRSYMYGVTFDDSDEDEIVFESVATVHRTPHTDDNRENPFVIPLHNSNPFHTPSVNNAVVLEMTGVYSPTQILTQETSFNANYTSTPASTTPPPILYGVDDKDGNISMEVNHPSRDSSISDIRSDNGDCHDNPTLPDSKTPRDSLPRQVKAHFKYSK
jgi:hypothetical protein